MRRDRDSGRYVLPSVSFFERASSADPQKGRERLLASKTLPRPYSRGKALYVVPPELRRKERSSARRSLMMMWTSSSLDRIAFSVCGDLMF